ncbi:MAG TPA: SMI1/KNR4 family protein [Parachlamydiaceae bacterium]|nr:SMI1/KNR4 family protein [Parachlamydiaceae bacterium]
MTIEKLKKELFELTDGSEVHKVVKQLNKLANKQREAVIDIFSLYMKCGILDHWRGFISCDLQQIVHADEMKYTEIFEQGLKQPETAYWSIVGLIKTAGRDCYEQMTDYALDEKNVLECRANAILVLADHSGQTFTKGLSQDPGGWKHEQLPFDALKQWVKDGFPVGEGFEKPKTHPALFKPDTEVEKIAAILEKKLVKVRDQDFNNLRQWLIPANLNDLQLIEAKWNLPSAYLEFLTKFSPVAVSFVSKETDHEIELFGASKLIEGQYGYSYNPKTKEPINDWPSAYLVIAYEGGDPYVLDLSKEKDGDAPVLTAEHGLGEWEFDEVAPTFKEFLVDLSKCQAMEL